MCFAKNLSNEKIGVLYFNKTNINTIDEKSTVSYQNSFYNFVFLNFTSLDFDLFISILCLLKERGKVYVDIDYKFFLNLMNKNKNYKSKNYSKKEFFLEFKDFVDKAMSVYFSNKSLNDNDLIYYSIFSKVELNKKQGNIAFLLNDEFFKIINNVRDGFYTSFLLKDFLKLKSKYSKMLFILLCQFLYKGSFYIDLKHIYSYFSLDVKDYCNRIANFDNYTLIPAITELQTMPKFKNLSCKKIKKDENNPKSKVIALYFTFWFWRYTKDMFMKFKDRT